MQEASDAFSELNLGKTFYNNAKKVKFLLLF